MTLQVGLAMRALGLGYLDRGINRVLGAGFEDWVKGLGLPEATSDAPKRYFFSKGLISIGLP